MFSAGNTAWVGPAQAIWIIAPVPPTSVTAAIDGNDILVSWTRPQKQLHHEFQVHTGQTDKHSPANASVANPRHRTGAG